MRDQLYGMRYDLPSLTLMYNRFQVPAAVVCTGSSLFDDMKLIPDEALLIAVNGYQPISCDYMVACDEPNNPNIIESRPQYQGRILSHKQAWSDFNLDVTPYYDGMSITTAIWFACYLTSSEVYLVGADCNTSKPTHYDGRHNEFEYKKDVLHKVQPILSTLRFVDNPERVIALQEPLKTLLADG
jgi:hypothetical protein